ncbi:hypothetical protein BMR02_13390 [Methylococcaceae bacterium HT1]|nr:hypothetical protein BMR02_13390 [Methylococcaceae bacterium HT1]
MYVLAAYDYSNIKVDEQPIAPSIVNQAATMEALILTGLELHSFKAPSGMLGQSGDIVRQIIVSSLNRGVAIFAKACFGHPSPSKQQKLNATTYASGGPDSSSSPRPDPTRGRNIGSK